MAFTASSTVRPRIQRGRGRTWHNIKQLACGPKSTETRYSIGAVRVLLSSSDAAIRTVGWRLI